MDDEVYYFVEPLDSDTDESDFNPSDEEEQEDQEEPEIGGFDHEFIDELLVNQKCAVCLLAMRNAVQTAKCGHRFCRVCLEESIRTNNSVCPTCRDPVNPADGFYDDIAWSRDILSLRVKCRMSGRGCEWTGEIRHAEEHQVECPFADVTCAKCLADFQRRHQQIHHTEQCPYRVVECTFCSERLHYCIKPEHEDEYCTRFPLACKNHCGSTDIPREEMEVHLSDHCPMTKVVCPYMEAGCAFEDKRAYLGEHIDASTDDHMDLLLTSLTDANQKLSKFPELEEKLKNLEEENKMLKESEAKRSEEAASLALAVKVLEVDNMKTTAKLEQWIARDATQKLSKFPELEEKLNNLEEENKMLKESEAKRSEEVASLALAVKVLEVDKMRTSAKLDQWIARVQGLEANIERTTFLSGIEIADTKKEVEGKDKDEECRMLPVQPQEKRHRPQRQEIMPGCRYVRHYSGTYSESSKT